MKIIRQITASWRIEVAKVLVVMGSTPLIAVACGQSSVQTPLPAPPVDQDTSVAPPAIPSLEVISVVGGSSSDYTVFLTRERGLWLVYGAPPEQLLPTETIVGAAVGPNHIMALTRSGTIYALGHNPYGQLGIESPDPQETPVKVPGIADVRAVAAGIDYSVALKTGGTVWSWGNNDAGQLGDETSGSRSSPTQIPGLLNIQAIAAGGAHLLALTSEGLVLAWGANDFGQLGNGTTDTEFVPVQVEEVGDVVSVAAGTNHSMALKDDGTVWVWGANDSGQLGVQTETSHSPLPIQIPGLSDIATIAAGCRYSLALTEDGEVWAWGENESGQLGIGSTKPSFIPVKIRGLIDILNVAAGRSHVIALRRDGTLWGWGDGLLLPGLAGSSIQMTPVIVLE